MVNFELLKKELKYEIPFDEEINIDEEINSAIESAKRKYSLNQPIQDFKILKFQKTDVTTLIESDFTTYLIDIYKNIDEKFIDFIYFKPLNEAKQDLYKYYPTLINYSDFELLKIWTTELYEDFIERYIEVKKRPIVRKGRYIPVKLNTYYVCYYNVMRDEEDFQESDYEILKDLAKIQLIKTILMSKKYIDACGVRSVSISGIRVDFSFPNREETIERLDALEKEILENIHDYFPVII